MKLKKPFKPVPPYRGPIGLDLHAVQTCTHDAPQIFGRCGRCGKSFLGVTHWICANGRTVTPAEMTDQHKLNCIRMIANSAKIHRLIRLRSMIDDLSGYGSAPEEARDQMLLEWLNRGEQPTFPKRAELAIRVSPVLAEMARLLRLKGIDPTLDQRRVLDDWDPIQIPTPERPRSLRRPPPTRRRPHARQARSSR